MMMKECPRRESFSDGSVGAKVRMMVRGGCLPVRGSGTMRCRYQDDLCGCGQVETEGHALFECNRYGKEREPWNRPRVFQNLRIQTLFYNQWGNDCGLADAGKTPYVNQRFIST